MQESRERTESIELRFKEILNETLRKDSIKDLPETIAVESAENEGTDGHGVYTV